MYVVITVDNMSGFKYGYESNDIVLFGIWADVTPYSHLWPFYTMVAESDIGSIPIRN